MLDDMIDEILRNEGGYVNHPADRGGPTNFGITERTYSEWLGRPVSLSEIRNMDEETAREIYERNYFRAPRIDTLPSPIQLLAFDCAINHGPRRAVRLVQNVCNEAGFGPVSVDGVMGPKSRSAAEKAQADMGNFFVNAIVDERLNFYRNIIANDPSQDVFWKGWRRRAESFRLPV